MGLSHMVGYPKLMRHYFLISQSWDGGYRIYSQTHVVLCSFPEVG